MIALPGILIVTNERLMLECVLGVFELRDKRLINTYNGRHQGFFEISRIELQNEILNGACTCYQVATLNAFHLQPTAFLHPKVSPPPQNEHPSTDNSTEVKTSPSLENCEELSTVLDNENNADAKLFGELWPLDVIVKLDPTVNRDILNKQHARLRELGYKPNHQTQTWQRDI